MTRRAVACLALVLAVGLGACGMIKVGYRNADTVGLLWINRYLDLSSDQKDFLKPRLRELVRWHSTTQLPDYVNLTMELKQRAGRDITAAEVGSLDRQLRLRAYAMVDHALPDMADLALQLEPDNIQAMRDKFAENDDKFRDEMMKGDIERQQKARYEKTLERVEEWYGRFDREQRAVIRGLSDARPLDNQMLLAERQRREQELIALLTQIQRDKPSRDETIRLLRGYSQRFEPSPDHDRQVFEDALHKATNEMNAAIHNLATPAQRARAVSKLQDWIEDFRSLET